MPRVHQTATHVGPIVGLLCVVLLLAALELTGGLGVSGWLTGVAAGAAGCVLLARGIAGRDPSAGLTPADRVTLVRLVIGCALAGLTVVASTGGDDRRTTVVLLAIAALLTDWLDGRVARSTGSVTSLGARFDMETDAFLILTMSVYVARTDGWWVVVIGLARYAFVAGRVVWPWLRGTLPPRYWCKVVAAMQGIVLTVVAADIVPAAWEAGLLVVALAFLAESFGREAWQLRMLATSPTAAGREPLVVETTAVREPLVVNAAGLAVVAVQPEGGLVDG